MNEPVVVHAIGSNTRLMTIRPVTPRKRPVPAEIVALHWAMASQVAFQARDFERARRTANRAILIDPEFRVGYMMLGQACEQLGECAVALDGLGSPGDCPAATASP